MLIENGLIREVGSTRRLENLRAVRNAAEISAAGRVVMPGFVDSHTHVISGPSRLPSDSLLAERTTRYDARMIVDNVLPVRQATSRRLTSEANKVLRHCLGHGTTTVEAKSGYGLTSSAELKILRVLRELGEGPTTVVPTFSAASVVPPEYEGRAEEYIDWLCRELLPVVHKRGLARFVDGSCDPGAFTAEQLRPLFDEAQRLGFPLKLNLAQFGSQRGAQLAAEYPLTSVDHLDYLDDAGIGHIAESGSIATLTPAASFFLERPFAPARALMERNVPVALASNYSRVTSPTYNMQLVIFLACHNLHMTPGEAVCGATINGAHAVRLGHHTGSLEAGKQADIILLSVGDYRELAFEFGINLVDMTIKKGAVVYDSSGVKWPEQL